MRLPVTSRRRCVQITALGAPDVPEVKMSAHRSVGDTATLRVVGRHLGQRRVEVEVAAPARGAAAPSAKRCDTSTGRSPRSRPARSSRWRRLGEDEVDVGVVDVAQQVLAHPGRVEPDHRGPGEAPPRRRRTGSPACCRAAPRRGWDGLRPSAGSVGGGQQQVGPPASTRPRTRRGSRSGRRSGWPDGRPGRDRWRCDAAATGASGRGHRRPGPERERTATSRPTLGDARVRNRVPTSVRA